jgi:hypothetical protein
MNDHHAHAHHVHHRHHSVIFGASDETISNVWKGQLSSTWNGCSGRRPSRGT